MEVDSVELQYEAPTKPPIASLFRYNLFNSSLLGRYQSSYPFATLSLDAVIALVQVLAVDSSAVAATIPLIKVESYPASLGVNIYANFPPPKLSPIDNGFGSGELIFTESVTFNEPVVVCFPIKLANPIFVKVPDDDTVNEPVILIEPLIELLYVISLLAELYCSTPLIPLAFLIGAT